MAPSQKKQTSTSTTTTTPAPAPVAVAAPAVAPVVEKKKAASKKTEESSTAATTVAPVVAVEKKAPVKEEASGEDEKKQRREVTRESVDEEFTQLIARISEEIEKRAPAQPAAATTDAPADGKAKSTSSKRKKDTGVPLKFLRTINKRLVALQTDVARATKLKKKSTRNNENSGLMKPVNISSALFQFLKSAKFDVEQNKMYPRVDITRFIHTYVKDNNLRKEKDKRVILPDAKLSALLNYDPKTAKDEMTYFRLPQYLKNHFINATAAEQKN